MSSSLVLEASAGTGKTYNIERLVLDALTQEPKLNIQEILVVTFTNASTRELKTRIRKLIASRLAEDPLNDALKMALGEFDSSSIFTIHGFCKRVLDEEAIASGLPFLNPANPADPAPLLELVEEVLRSESFQKGFTHKQCELLLKKHSWQPFELCRRAADELRNETLFAVLEANDQLWEKIEKNLSALKGEKLSALAPFFKETNGWDRELLDQFCTFDRKEFDESGDRILDGIEGFLPGKRKKKHEHDELPVANRLVQELLPLVRAMYDYPSLFIRLCALAKERYEERVKEEGPLSFSALISSLERLVRTDCAVKERLQKRYKLVLIDEFQDTDPLQWSLFKELFLHPGCRMVLVGDPKQSIYGFRNADIYTYLNAVEALPEGCKRPLDTNFRSSPALVEALNHFFSLAPGWIPLPGIKSSLPYLHVKAGRKDLLPERPFKCLLGKEDEFYPYFASEVKRLHSVLHIPYEEIAFLVRSKQEGKELYTYLKKANIPSKMLFTPEQEESEAFQEWIDLVRAIENPKDLKKVKKALCGKIFGFKPGDLENGYDNAAFLHALSTIIEAKECAKTKGVASVLYFWLQEAREKLFLLQEGDLFYEHALEILSPWLNQEPVSPDLFIKGLFKSFSEETSIPADGEGVRIVTLHASKGLEYRAVFLPGVSKQNRADSGLVKVKTALGKTLQPLYADEKAFDNHLEEEDAEKARLLYVAMTRARDYLYLPIPLNQRKPGKGKASPLSLFMARCEDPGATWEELYAILSKGDFSTFIESLSRSGQVEKIDLEKHTLYQGEVVLSPPQLLKPPPAQFSYPEERRYSFSSLAVSVKEAVKTPLPNELPLGQETGLLLHEIFENIPLDLVKNADTAKELEPYVAKHLVNPSYNPFKEQIAEILFLAFTTPLAPIPLSLRDLSEAALFREMEFYYDATLAQSIPELKQAHGVVKGVIDLCFNYEGRIYMIDWKSNWLSSYDENSLKREMMAHRYDLQEKIYRQALKQYGLLTEGSYGGSFYIFLRGLPSSAGIHFIEGESEWS